MENEGLGPATPGTAARDPVDLSDWSRCPCGKPAGPEFRYGLCDWCAELTPASALLRMGQHAGNAALAASKSVPEIERLKAENASLLESLREAELEAKEALDFWERANEYAQVLSPKRAAAAQGEEK